MQKVAKYKRKPKERFKIYKDFDEAVAMYLSGFTIKEVAKRFKVCKDTLGYAFNYCGVKKRSPSKNMILVLSKSKHKRSKIHSELNKAVKMYKSGSTLEDIGKKYGYDRSYIGQLFKKNGIKKRSRSEYMRLAVRQGKMPPQRNFPVYGPDNYRWKGGKFKHKYGYIYKYAPNHPRAKTRNYVFEHILIMEKKIGRYIKPNEVVHHINGKRDDNRVENLAVMTIAEHSRLHDNFDNKGRSNNAKR